MFQGCRVLQLLLRDSGSGLGLFAKLLGIKGLRIAFWVYGRARRCLVGSLRPFRFSAKIS